MPQPMSEQYAPPNVTIRRYRASDVCDVVVVVRGKIVVLRCPDYPRALKWARLECKFLQRSQISRIIGQRAIGRTAVILALSGAPFPAKICVNTTTSRLFLTRNRMLGLPDASPL